MTEPLVAAGPAAIPYRRSPLQVSLLLIGSLGFYIFVWAFWARRWASATIEKEDQPLWKSVALIVPILSLFMMFDIGKRIEGTAWRAGYRVGGHSLAWAGASIFLINVLWKLPAPYSLLGIASFVPLARMQYVLVRSASILDGERAAPTRLNPVEWIVIVLGVAFWLLIAYGSTIPDSPDAPPNAPWFPVVVGIATIVALVFIARANPTRVTSAATTEAP